MQQHSAVPAGSPQTVLVVATDLAGSPLMRLKMGTGAPEAYAPYGSPTAPAATDPGIGFRGSIAERVTGWHLLGNGLRAYDPRILRFHRPDRQSPFGKGGVNAYAYCANDPVNRSDPSGAVSVSMLSLGMAASGGSFLLGVAEVVLAKVLSDQSEGSRQVLVGMGGALMAIGVGGAIGTYAAKRTSKVISAQRTELAALREEVNTLENSLEYHADVYDRLFRRHLEQEIAVHRANIRGLLPPSYAEALAMSPTNQLGRGSIGSIGSFRSSGSSGSFSSARSIAQPSSWIRVTRG